MTRPLAALLLVVCPLVAADPAAETWPQWRGPNRDGASPGPAWPDRLADSAFKQVWRAENLGESYSGPVVTADRVFSTETVGKKTEVVKAFDRKTGKELWKVEWDGATTVPFFAARTGAWIRSTPAFDGDALYVAGIRDVLVCLAATDGKERWRYDFVDKAKTAVPAFGTVSSPLVDKTGVYVQAGGAAVKLDKKTGELVWRALEDKDAMNGSAFASPVFGKLAGRDQVVVQTRSHLAGVDKGTGAVIWKKEIPAYRGMNILTPVPVGDGVFTSTYGGNTRLVTVVAGAGTEVGTADAWGLKYEGNMTTPVVVDGHA